MLFRIVGPHIHRAMVGKTTFSCIRETTTTDAGLVVSWMASRNDVVLKGDCRTLNEAKNLCRSHAATPPVAVEILEVRPE